MPQLSIFPIKVFIFWQIKQGTLELQLIDAFILIGLVQGLFLTALILGLPQYRSKANSYLAVTILCVTIIGTLTWLSDIGIDNAWLTLFGDWMWEFLFIVTFLYYFLEHLEIPWRNISRMFLLYLPFIITLLVNVVIDLDEEFGWYDLNLSSNLAFIEGYYFIEYTLSLVFVLVVSFWAFILIRKYGQDPAKQWLQKFWWMSNAVILLWLFDYITDISTGQDFVKLLWLLVTVVFFWVTYSGIAHLKVAEDQQEIRKELEHKKLQVAWPNMKPNNGVKNLYLEKLNRLIREEKLYLDPDISRDRIAELLDISPGYLSQIINEQSGGNFSDYINLHRVEAVKAMLVDPTFDQYSIVAIGHEAGFNSKSNFYAVFKRQTRQTPSEFKKSIIKA